MIKSHAKLFMDEFNVVPKNLHPATIDFLSYKPTVGKSKALKKAMKKLNKQRKKRGLKKIKVKNIKLKTPKNWGLVGYQFPKSPD